MSDAPAWVNQPVINEKLKLNEGQVEALLKMTAMLQDPYNLKQIAEIKENCQDEDYYGYAKVLFDEFSDEEKHALWVAPSYGGVFTTHERKVLQNGV